jgi:hypothetical protein
MANYPPLQHPFVDVSGKMSRPWAQYFLAFDTLQSVTLPTGSGVTLVGVEHSQPVTVTLGIGMGSTDHVLFVDPDAAKPEAFYYEPETNQSVTAPALVYHEGDVTMVRVRIP